LEINSKRAVAGGLIEAHTIINVSLSTVPLEEGRGLVK
jgi:hypothetical protein